MIQEPVAKAEVTLTRIFDAPLDLVWEVWTQAEHVKNWWGPHHFDNPICEWDAKVGGKILIHMQGPEGPPNAMTGEFVEVIKPLSLVFTTAVDAPDGTPVLRGKTAVTFTEQGGKTHLVVVSDAAGFVEYAEQMLAYMELGWSQSLEKLADTIGAAR